MTIRRSSHLAVTVSLLAPLGLLLGCGAQRNDTSRSSGGNGAAETDAGSPRGENSIRDATTTRVGPVGSSTSTPTTTDDPGASGATGNGQGASGPTGASPSGTTGVGPTGPTGPIGGSTGPSGGSGCSPFGCGGGSGSSGASGGFGSTGSTQGPTGGAVVGGTGWGSSGPTGGIPPLYVSFTEPWQPDEACTLEATTECVNLAPSSRYSTIGGNNQMPVIEWARGPEGTASYALSFADLTDETAHWVMWDIPVSDGWVGPYHTPEGAVQTALVGRSWVGPDACDHLYEVVVYAISEPSINVAPNVPIANLFEQLQTDDSVVLAKDFIRLYPYAPCGD